MITSVSYSRFGQLATLQKLAKHDAREEAQKLQQTNQALIRELKQCVISPSNPRFTALELLAALRDANQQRTTANKDLTLDFNQFCFQLSLERRQPLVQAWTLLQQKGLVHALDPGEPGGDVMVLSTSSQSLLKQAKL